MDLNVDTAARSTKNSQKSLPPQEQPGSAREESQDTPSNPPSEEAEVRTPGDREPEGVEEARRVTMTRRR